MIPKTLKELLAYKDFKDEYLKLRPLQAMIKPKSSIIRLIKKKIKKKNKQSK